MSPNKSKGIEELYEKCCEGAFYEWLLPNGKTVLPLAAERHICTAPVYYHDAKALTLIEEDYNSLDEFNSTWKLSYFSARRTDKRLPHRPYKEFQLESDDDLIVVKCKIRPVLLIKKISSDWKIPGNSANLFNTWLCLPIFSYKSRHSQQYVITDQSFGRPDHFYFPSGNPGLLEEGVGKLTELQFISEENLGPFNRMCYTHEPKMQRAFRVSVPAFKIVIGHIANFLPTIELSGDCRDWYNYIVELVQEEIKEIVK